MLLEYGFKNFLSFKEGALVSLQLDSNVPLEISRGLPASTILCVKGANGSGKTHLLKALAFIAYFASHSFNLAPKQKIDVAPFFDSTEPTSFYIKFTKDNIEYTYELEVNQDEVISEYLYKKEKRKTLIFQREKNIITCPDRLSLLREIKIRSNASTISTAYQHQVKELIPIFEFFDEFSYNVTASGHRQDAWANINTCAEILHNDSDLLDAVSEFIEECDVGISRIEILSNEDDEGKLKYFPVFIHEVNGREMPVFPSTESSGTKQILRMLLHVVLSLKTGRRLIIDEIDIYLHPLILQKLLGLFISPQTNPTKSQLIFSSHNTEVLDFCGRYRTYFTNKNNNESYTYRLDEIPGDILRNDRSIIPAYNEKKIGGVPNL